MGCELKRIFVLLLLFRICEYAAASTPSLALPNCRSRCGDVLVPYPFGIGKGCYKDKWYEIICINSSQHLSVPFIPSIKREVISFALGDPSFEVISFALGDPLSYLFSYNDYVNKFHIHRPLKHTGCSNGSVGDSSSLNLTGSPFYISEANRLTAIGCNNKALMKGTGLQIVGCEATCENEVGTYYGYSGECVGYKCCQATVPSGLQVFDATVEKLEPGKGGCQVAYLTNFTLEASMFTPPQLPEYRNYLMMQLEWDLNVPLERSLLCKYTLKEDTGVVSGYHCSCKFGYEGNPYLPGGCQDVDECSDPYPVCGKNKCVNVDGSFRCVKTWPAILGGTLSCGLLLLVVGTWWLCKVNKKRKAAKQKRKFFKRNGGLLLEQQTISLQGSVNRTKLFSSGDLEKATDKFNPNRILGQGGQGTVYKGMLEDGMIVAVKKSKALEEENLEEFINEIILLSQINHRNVVKIFGCCLETEVPLLVYEFIPHGSLFDHLQNPSEDFTMTWEVRLCIACEVADALSYLHSAASIPIYHRDVKSTNILLDERYRAKVSDFGISRSVPIDDTHLTTLVQGTVGYVDPEYLQSSHFTAKSDVYSFGVVLIELLTGGKPVSLLRSQEFRMLGAYFLEAMRNGRLHEILDARIKKECDQEEVLAVAKLARSCLNLNSEHRPTMRDVFVELDRMQSKKKGTQSQAQNGEEHARIQIVIPESMSLSYSSPNIVVENSSFSLDSKPLMPHKTQTQ